VEKSTVWPSQESANLVMSATLPVGTSPEGVDRVRNSGILAVCGVLIFAYAGRGALDRG